MKPRPIRIEGDLAYVPLTQGRTAVIDAADRLFVEGRNWFFITGYAATWVRAEDGRRQTVWMHRLIAATPNGMETDHISGDGLDNRRSNLRHATKSQNLQNRSAQTDNKSGLKGVSLYQNKTTCKWRATIILQRKQRHLGYFATPEAAHEAYCQAAKAMHGEFARTA
jgi:hypothetical protein